MHARQAVFGQNPKIMQKQHNQTRVHAIMMVWAAWIEILEPLPVLIEGLPRLLLDARNFLPYGCCPWSREELGYEQSLQVIPARDGPGCKVVQPVFRITLQRMRESLLVYMVLLDIYRLHGGTHDMKLVQVFARVLTYKTMKLWQQVY